MSIFKELSKSLEQATGYFEGKENSTKVTHIEFARPDVFTVRHWFGPGTDKQVAVAGIISWKTLESAHRE